MSGTVNRKCWTQFKQWSYIYLISSSKCRIVVQLYYIKTIDVNVTISSLPKKERDNTIRKINNLEHEIVLIFHTTIIVVARTTTLSKTMPITLTKYILVILHSSPFYLENPSRVLAVKEIASSRSIILFRSPIQYHRFLFNNSIPRPCSISAGPVQSLRSVFCEDSPSFLLNSSPSRSLYQPLTPSQYVSRWRPMRDRCFNIGSALIYSSCRSAFSLKVAMLS